MNTEFTWDKNSLSQGDTISSILWSIHKEMVRESIDKIKNVKTAGLSDVVSEMIKIEARVEMITAY